MTFMNILLYGYSNLDANFGDPLNPNYRYSRGFILLLIHIVVYCIYSNCILRIVIVVVILILILKFYLLPFNQGKFYW
jgi:hypothetical protein